YARFNLAKLVPGAQGDPDTWYDYATNDRAVANLISLGGDRYRYRFSVDIAADYEPGLTHRLAMQHSRIPPDVATANPIYDFVPDGSPVERQRAIVDVAQCNDCHGGLSFHGNGRNDTRMCVMCHNPTLPDVDFGYMVHKIHAAQNLPNVHDYSEVTYPQDINNCAKCHTGDNPNTPDGDNWKNAPNKTACGSCHNVVFEEPVPEGMAMHTAGPQATNAGCAGCHQPEVGVAPIVPAHMTENATPHNPQLPAGLSNIAYELLDAEVDAEGVATITFRITRDGAAIDLLNLPEDLAAPGRWPGFLLPYALPGADGVMPADWNNLGRSAGQPASVDIGGLIEAGSVAAGADGAFVATIADAFPAGAGMRAVALQGYFQQAVGESNVARHAVSAYIPVTGDEVRREIVDSAKCGSCHEWFEGHGGNRVYTTSVCATCHNPNLSSSGRGADPEALSEGLVAALGDDPLTYPEDTNNFKELIHGIHASAVRTTDYEFVRNFRGGSYYNWSEIMFPAEASACETCHFEGTWRTDDVPATALPTTVVTTDGTNADRDAVLAARDSVPNATDVVTTPIAGACNACHDSAPAQAHYEQNGGLVERDRAQMAE
ncbi:MAG: OmcA/MtrC family decaheme c-type cytochrome, partial [Myxococcales bacterium]|nr:OmcA/MtrC family decaheme c-type cytochrome [Myxococcales bacterium]